jgi:hypothetical protein
VDQSNAVTFGVGPVDSLISNFSNRGSLYNVPVVGSEEEGLSKLVLFICHYDIVLTGWLALQLRLPFLEILVPSLTMRAWYSLLVLFKTLRFNLSIQMAKPRTVFHFSEQNT